MTAQAVSDHEQALTDEGPVLVPFPDETDISPAEGLKFHVAPLCTPDGAAMGDNVIDWPSLDDARARVPPLGRCHTRPIGSPAMRTSSDRISALRRMTAPDLAAVLERVPNLARSLDGDGPLGPVDEGYGPVVTRTDRSLTHLGVLMASPRGVGETIACLNMLERQLIALAVLHDGVLEREQVVGEAGDHRELDQAQSALAQLLLAHPAYEQGEWLVLRPGVARHVPLPGVRIYDALHTLPGSDLDVLLQRLGATELPYRHEDRRRLVGKLQRQPRVAAELRDLLDADALRVLDMLVHHGGQRVADLGLPPFDPWDRRGGPLHECVQLGLVGVDTARQEAFAWLDVGYGMRGRLFDHWPVSPPPADPRPLHDPGPRTPPVLRRAQMLLELWATEPPDALAKGGLGVRPIRAAAKGFGVEEGIIGLLVHLTIDLGLLGETEDGRWAPTPALTDFLALPPAEQWWALATMWRRSTTIDEKAGLPARWSGEMAWPPPMRDREAVLDVLLSFEEGTGVDADTMVQLVAWRSPDALGAGGAEAMIAAMRALDLVPADGPVGLTAAARALLADGAGAAAGVLGPAVEDIVVQADHSVIAAPGLSPRVAGQLSAIATLESDAGAQIWRITAGKVAEAMADGRTRDEIVDFLVTASTVPPPANVLVTIDDVAARHGRLRAGTIGCFLRGDDPADVATAASVSAAKLRVIAPTVAVSPLSRDAMMKALRSRGIIAVAEDGDGALIPPGRTSGVAIDDTGIPAAETVERPDALALAEELLASEGARK